MENTVSVCSAERATFRALQLDTQMIVLRKTKLWNINSELMMAKKETALVVIKWLFVLSM